MKIDNLGNTKVIGLSGPARSGKNTTAHLIVEKYGCAQIAFADPIREALFAMLCDPISPEFSIIGNLHYYINEDKESIIPGIGVSARKLMQSLGTQWARKTISDNFWINLAKLRIEKMLEWRDRHSNSRYRGDRRPYPGIVISDVRFENEARFIKENNGSIFKVVRRNVEKARDHESELGINDAWIDGEITNDGTIDDLEAKLKKALLDILPPCH